MQYFMKKMMSCMNGPQRALLKHTTPRYAMNSGDGPHSYAQNSSYARAILEVATPIIEEAIATKLDIITNNNSNNAIINIADFGCSTGHGSFPAMQFITQSIYQKLQQLSTKIPEFYVYFNDLFVNDFNTLVTSLPLERRYRAAIIPGDFHHQLLPQSSLHFGYSAWSFHWLTRAPEAVEKSDSPAWNKGEVFYTSERKEVCDAYLDEFERDMESLLEARAVEMVGGGVLAFVIVGVPESWNPREEYTMISDFNLLGSCLMDMATEGRLNESKVDSFNFPLYFSTPQQLKAILGRSQSFTTERIEVIKNPDKHTMSKDINARAALFRAIFEGMITNHFGSEVMIDELFNLYRKKLAALPVLLNPDNDKNIALLAILKRKID